MPKVDPFVEKIDPVFNRTTFSRLVADLKNLPVDGRPQIAIAGKSNAGKSSFINRLCRQNKLAKTSSMSGKTRNLLFFDVNHRFYLVDLPGYGFSQSSQKEKERFSALTEGYFQSFSPIFLTILLLDARHLPTEQDLQMVEYLRASHRPFLVGLNKSDKLSQAQASQMKKKIAQYLEEHGAGSVDLCSISAETGRGIYQLSQLILNKIEGER